MTTDESMSKEKKGAKPRYKVVLGREYVILFLDRQGSTMGKFSDWREDFLGA